MAVQYRSEKWSKKTIKYYDEIIKHMNINETKFKIKIKLMKNFLPKQYKIDSSYEIKHNYLSEQFKDYKKILRKFEKIIKNNDFTLGKEVDIFENNIKKLLNQKYVVAVGSGTDALMLSLKCLGIKEGDEVITTPYTFYATIGAIVTAGAKPIFVDIRDDYNIDPNKIEKKLQQKLRQ